LIWSSVGISPADSLSEVTAEVDAFGVIGGVNEEESELFVVMGK